MTAEIAVVGEYSVRQKEIMLETVAKGCKPEQFMLMLELAKKYKLDPFARQIWATPMGIIVGRDGFLALAHNSGNFDGMSTTFQEKDGRLISATTEVWHKRMSHPITFTARFNEFNRPNSDAWKKMPYVMLQKCSESHALRRAFCVTGLYDEAELSRSPPLPPEDPPVVEFATTATMDGEPVPVQVLPGKCSKCRRHDTLTAAYREKYQAAFDEAGLTLPGGVCEECARELWREQVKGYGGENR